MAGTANHPIKIVFRFNLSQTFDSTIFIIAVSMWMRKHFVFLFLSKNCDDDSTLKKTFEANEVKCCQPSLPHNKFSLCRNFEDSRSFSGHFI